MAIENNTIMGFNKIYFNGTTKFVKRDRKKPSR